MEIDHLATSPTLPQCQALPPSAQSLREIKTILNDPRLFERMSVYPIIEILATNSGYVIKTPDREIRVVVRYLPSERIGPLDFELIFE